MLAVAGLFVVVVGSPAWAPCHIGSFVGAPYTVAEGDGSVTIIYSNGSGSQPGGSVDYRTVDGTARAGRDYTATSGTLSWGNVPVGVGVNPAFRSFSVPILQDAIDESTESFSIEMSHFTGCFDAGLSDKTARVSITDDDVTPTTTRPTGGPPVSETPTHPPASPTDQASVSKAAPEQSSTPTPHPAETQSPLAAADRDEGGGGLSGGGVVAIAVAVAAVGGAAVVWIRRRLLT